MRRRESLRGVPLALRSWRRTVRHFFLQVSKDSYRTRGDVKDPMQHPANATETTKGLADERKTSLRELPEPGSKVVKCLDSKKPEILTLNSFTSGSVFHGGQNTLSVGLNLDVRV